MADIDTDSVVSTESDVKDLNVNRQPELASKVCDSSMEIVENVEVETLDIVRSSSSMPVHDSQNFTVVEEAAVVAVISDTAVTPSGGKRQLGEVSVGVVVEGESIELGTLTSVARPRLNINKAAKIESSHSARNSGKERWRPHKMTEDYTNFVGELMYPKTSFGPYGTAPEKNRFPVSRINTLGYLISPLRRPTVLEKWSPYELSVFEASLTLFGKDFWQASKIIKTKSTREVIELYYSWKKTDHYKQWKKSYIPDARDFAEA